MKWTDDEIDRLPEQKGDIVGLFKLLNVYLVYLYSSYNTMNYLFPSKGGSIYY